MTTELNRDDDGPKGPCAFCGAESSGHYSVHRDGYCVGPLVPLCNACGGSPTPTLEEIWAKTAKTMGPNDYRCAVCEDIFEKGRPDEIAHAEAKARAPNVPIEECSVVCDDCFKEMAHAGVFPS